MRTAKDRMTSTLCSKTCRRHLQESYLRSGNIMYCLGNRDSGLAVGSLDVMPIIETARGVESAKKIATADSRIKRMAFGGGDYTLDLNYEWEADEAVLSYARAKLSHASRLGDLEPPIDTVVLQIKDNDRFLQSARRGKQFGFGG